MYFLGGAGPERHKPVPGRRLRSDETGSATIHHEHRNSVPSRRNDLLHPDYLRLDLTVRIVPTRRFLRKEVVLPPLLRNYTPRNQEQRPEMRNLACDAPLIVPPRRKVVDITPSQMDRLAFDRVRTSAYGRFAQSGVDFQSFPSTCA